MFRRWISSHHFDENLWGCSLKEGLNTSDAANGWADAMSSSQHVYEIRPRKDKRGFDLISDALPFGRLCMASQMRSATQSFAAVHTLL